MRCPSMESGPGRCSVASLAGRRRTRRPRQAGTRTADTRRYAAVDANPNPNPNPNPTADTLRYAAVDALELAGRGAAQ